MCCFDEDNFALLQYIPHQINGSDDVGLEIGAESQLTLQHNRLKKKTTVEALNDF